MNGNPEHEGGHQGKHSGFTDSFPGDKHRRTSHEHMSSHNIKTYRGTLGNHTHTQVGDTAAEETLTPGTNTGRTNPESQNQNTNHPKART